jgi:UrcA family protein
MNTTITTRAIAGIAALTLTAFVHAAHANGIDGPVSKTVAYGDLNLDSVSGAKVLYRRIQTAAREVCSPLDSKGLAFRAAWQSCYDHAIDAAVDSVNSSAVAQVHAQSTGHTPAG